MSAPATLVLGYGLANRAVVDALRRHGADPVVVDDRPSDATRAAAAAAGVALVEAPTDDELAKLVAGADRLVPSPGVPDRHPVFSHAADHAVEIWSEFDLASSWDDRPVLAITGTDGKTTVTTMVEQMMTTSGIGTVAAGNTDIPLVAAIADDEHELFVVEASSFRLGHSHRFAPAVGTWLNFGPDHLDVHRSLDSYEASKASLWARANSQTVAIANVDDPVVMAHLPATAEVQTFGRDHGQHYVANGTLVLDGQPLVDVADMPRTLPHDLTNGLAAAATALAGGASIDGIATVLREFRGLPHRVEFITEHDGVRFFNDSKATTPNAVDAALQGFESVVLIAGGKNKGLDLAPLAAHRGRLRAVVAIGDAADHVVEVFGDVVPTERAGSMDSAVSLAASKAHHGDAVLLSPGCASFDWYDSYKARGVDFSDEVRRQTGASQ